MKKLEPAPKFLFYAVVQAIRHPRTPITYGYCSECKVRVVPNAGACPICKNHLKENPETRRESPIPWWGSVACILIGIGAWVTSACLEVPGLDETARALVYLPLGNLFGLSIKKS